MERDPIEALRESEERLRTILDTAVDSIITIDERGIVSSMNRAAERLFGYAAADVIGRNVSMLMPEPYQSQHDRYLHAYLQTGEARIIGIGREVVGRRQDGTTFPMDLAVSEVKLGDRRIFTGIVRDLTETKRMQRELLEISDREQRRIGRDLHDGLGQVLAGIGYMSKALEQRLLSEGASGAEDAKQITNLVTQAIAQARAMARGLHPVRQIETGLMQALEELANAVANVYRVNCTFHCPVPVIIADETSAMHAYRIAQEAVNNAMKHGKARSISINLTCDDDHATLSVTDDGIGFDDGSTTKKGLGLHIMKYRAAMVSGTISIRRGVSGGTTVTCIFPMTCISAEREENGVKERTEAAAQE